MIPDEILDECLNELPVCSTCKGNGWIAAHAMAYDSIPCPKCNKERKEPMYETHSGAPLLNCPHCGGSLCAEEYHDCDREYEWQRTHG